MFTQCRGCGEVFSVTVDDIVTANAMVRCSSCGTVFNSLQTLSDFNVNESDDLILHDSDNPPPLLTHDFKESIVKEKIKESTKPQSEQNSIHDELIDNDITQEDVTQASHEDVFFNVQPDFVEKHETRTSFLQPTLWVLLTSGCIALLLWQATIALKKGTLQLPKGKLKQVVCVQVECFDGVKKSKFNKIALVSRSIRKHNGRDNALVITTGIINSDENNQPFPALQVKMSNLDGKVVAMRRFLPSEYVSEEINSMGMLPNTLIPITLELQSPGNNAVTFEIGFSETFGSR